MEPLHWEETTVRKSQWQQSNNGPDWTDIGIYLGELEALHRGECTLIISRATTGDSSAVLVTVHVMSNEPGPGLKPRELALKHTWPTARSKTFEGLIFRLLHELDATLSREWWKQSDFT